MIANPLMIQEILVDVGSSQTVDPGARTTVLAEAL